MPRTLLAALALAAAAAAQDLPLIQGAGTSLETFEVRLRLEAVDRGTAEGLAKSFARFEEEQHEVRRRFAQLVRDAHLDLLRRYYANELVERQAKAYDAVEQKGYRSEVTSVLPAPDKATAQLKRTYIVGARQREETTEIDLACDGTTWRIAAIRDKGRDGKFVQRPIGAPPPLKSAAIPAPVTPDLSSAKATVTSLRDDVLRFGSLRDNAALSLTDRFFDITAAFYGEAVARKAREGRPEAKQPPPVALEIGEPAPRLADLLRVEVTVNEEVGGKAHAVGQGAFDLRAEDGKWRIAGEYLRPDPEAPYQAIQANYALFFLVRR